MSNINKQELREGAERAQAARARLESMPDEDVVLFEDDDIKSDVSTCNKFIVTANPATVLALLDELEAAEKRIAELTEKPIGWTDEQELRDVEKLGCGYLFNANPITPHADPRRVILLYATSAGKGE